MKHKAADAYGVVSNLRKNRGGWIIYVGAKSVDALADLVRRHLLSSFDYKLRATKKGGPKAALKALLSAE